MKGYQLTFFTQQNRRHAHMALSEWLLERAKELGAIGGTLAGGEEGFGHAGLLHSAHFIELADQPIAVTVSVNDAVCQKLMAVLAEEEIDLSYVKVPIEYGRIGKAVK